MEVMGLEVMGLGLELGLEVVGLEEWVGWWER